MRSNRREERPLTVRETSDLRAGVRVYEVAMGMSLTRWGRLPDGLAVYIEFWRARAFATSRLAGLQTPASTPRSTPG